MNQRIDRLGRKNEHPQIWGTLLFVVITTMTVLYAIFYQVAMNNGG